MFSKVLFQNARQVQWPITVIPKLEVKTGVSQVQDQPQLHEIDLTLETKQKPDFF